MIIRLFFILLTLSFNAWAENYSDKPAKVLVGVHPTALHNFDYSRETFNITFDLWTFSKDKNYDPTKTLEIINSVDTNIKNSHKEITNRGIYTNNIRIYATIIHFWKVKNFPFDRQRLKIEFEDQDPTSDVLLLPDNNSTLSKEIKLDGWEVLGTKIKSENYIHNTNFGDIEAKNDKYSRLTFYIDIKRKGMRLFLNFFIGFLVAIILSSFIFFINPKEIGARSSYALSAIFCAVGNKYVIDRYLPAISEYTFSDSIQLVGFVFILSAVSTTMITYHMALRGHSDRAKAVSRRTGFIMIPIACSLIIMSLARAILS